MNRLEALYARLPVFAQHSAATAFGVYRHWLRFGPGYSQKLREYRDREWLSSDDLARAAEVRLTSLLRSAATHVPYYRDAWTRDQKQAAFEGQLSALPLLGKDPIRSDYRQFCHTDRAPRFLSTFTTSGSTGTPLSTVWTPGEVRDSRALREARSAGWAGVSFTQGRATFSGRLVVPQANSLGPFHRYNAIERQVYFSAFHLSARTAPAYVEAIVRHKPVWLTGYANSFYHLARHVIEQKLEIPPVQAVITTSEKLTHQMRDVISEAFRCRVFEEYSSVENAVFASECEQGSLHVSSDAGVVEILRADGTPCRPGEVGEVVATSFVRTFQPFIRYRLGDLACWAEEPCACGRSLPVIKEVVGRIEDALIGADGREIVRFHGVFLGLPSVVEGQIVQLAINHIVVKVVADAPIEGSVVETIKQRVSDRMGPVNVDVEVVSQIPRSAAGKFKSVVCLVKPG